MTRCAICGTPAGKLTRNLAIESGWTSVPRLTETQKNGRIPAPNLVCPKCTAPLQNLPEAVR